MYVFPVSFVLVYSTNTVRQVTFLTVKIKNQGWLASFSFPLSGTLGGGV